MLSSRPPSRNVLIFCDGCQRFSRMKSATRSLNRITTSNSPCPEWTPKLSLSRFSNENFFGRLKVAPVSFTDLIRAGTKVRRSLRK